MSSADQCPRCRYGATLEGILSSAVDLLASEGHNRLAGLHDLAALIVLTLANVGNEPPAAVLVRLARSVTTGRVMNDVPNTCGKPS